MTTKMEQLELGPILGFHDANNFKVWVRTASPAPELWVRWVKATEAARWDGSGFLPLPRNVAFSIAKLEPKSEGHGYGTAQALVGGLEPDARYFYEVVGAEELKQSPRDFCNKHPPSFRSLSKSPDKLRFAFLSCHSTEKTPRGRRPDTVWHIATNRLIAREGAYFALLGGDQVYADSIPAEVRKQRRRNEDYGYGDAYADLYRDQWDWDYVRLFMAHLPCMMMWDDHEIINGWGSRGDEGEPAMRQLFGAASSAFDRHQAIHNPPRLGRDTRAFGFRVATAAFVVLDGRSHRGRAEPGAEESGVLGQPQWQQLKSWLEAQEGVSHLIVVTAIPLVFLPESITRRKLLGEFVSDLVDQWSSPKNAGDQLKLLGTLFEFRKRTGAHVVLLGGDVHVATTATITSDDHRYLLSSEPQALLHQVISSGISHSPAPALFYKTLRNGYSIRSAFLARFGEIYYSRSFAEIELRSEDRRCRCDLFLEEENAATTYDWPGP